MKYSLEQALTKPRAAGTTFRQIRECPDGTIYFVHLMGMRYQVEAILREQGRSTRALDVRILRGRKELRGLRKDQFEIDHAWFPNVNWWTLREVMDEIEAMR